MKIFQSTLPVRGATRQKTQRAQSRGISIHAPREGSDLLANRVRKPGDISIHAPREGSDLRPEEMAQRSWHFNPRSP